MDVDQNNRTSVGNTTFLFKILERDFQDPGAQSLRIGEYIVQSWGLLDWDGWLQLINSWLIDLDQNNITPVELQLFFSKFWK